MRRLFIILFGLLASDAAAQPPPDPPLPPSPFGDDPHGVYERTSNCWIWSAMHKADRPMEHFFMRSAACNGKALEGAASLHWSQGPYAGQTWDGQFDNGRFTGVATVHYTDAQYEAHFRQGLRNGAAHYTFNDGNTLDQNYRDDLEDGRTVATYADGTRSEHQFEMGKPAGIAVQTYVDGSRMECPEPSDCREPPGGTMFSAAGVKLPGLFIAAKTDPRNPPLVYPPISIRLNEQGSVLVTGQILKDGTVRDPKVLRSSGSARLDESALTSVRGWMFRPATLDSQPVDAYWRMALTFSLRDARTGE